MSEPKTALELEQDFRKQAMDRLSLTERQAFREAADMFKAWREAMLEKCLEPIGTRFNTACHEGIRMTLAWVCRDLLGVDDKEVHRGKG